VAKTLFYCTGFEHGVAAPVTSGGGLFSTVTGTPVIQGTTKRTGDYALQVSVAAAASSVRRLIPGSPTELVARFYINFGTLPTSGTVELFQVRAVAGGYFCFCYSYTEKQFYGYVEPSANVYYTSMSPAINTWYRIDLIASVATANLWTLDCQIDGVAQTQATDTSHAASTLNGVAVLMGCAASTTMNAYFDDWAMSVTTADYPLGATDGVIGLRPDSDTDITAVGTNTMELIDGTDISAGSPAYAMLDENPWTTSANTDLVCQNTANTSAYVEMGFANTTYANINGVMALLQYCGQNASADQGATYILEGANVTTVYGNNATRADYSETTPYYKAVIVTPPANGWTPTDVNGLKVRIGHSNDVVAVPYWLALMLEVDGNGTAAAANNYTLACDGTTMASAGIAVDFLRARIMDTGIAAYTTAGEAVIMGGQYTLSADSGSYASSGISVTPLFAAKVRTEIETYSTVGKSAVLESESIVEGDLGLYASEGETVLLKGGFLFTPGIGTHVIAGQEPELQADRIFDVGAGAHETTGVPATMLLKDNLIKFRWTR